MPRTKAHAMLLVALTPLLVALLAGCVETPPGPPTLPAELPSWMPLPGAHPDPLANGPLGWTTEDYALGEVMVGGPDAGHRDYEYKALLRGTLTMPEGDGPFPLAVFLHGQHTTCGGSDGGEADLLEDCVPYRNDRGYVYLMEHLASHGMAVASVLAHEVNQRNGGQEVGMRARAELVLATIDALAEGKDGPRLDLTRIGLMGHSRGGEGVVTAAEVNAERAEPHALAGIVALAPTDFALRSVTGVPFLTLAPYCDGDVYSLHGLRQFDQSRHVDDATAKVQLLVMGANHNNYNTMWGRDVGGVPILGPQGDDAGYGRHQNTHCDLPRSQGGGRLSLEETYTHAKLHIGGFLRWTVLGDATLAPYFLGADPHPSACPGQSACPGAVHASAMTPGRRDLFHVAAAGAVPAAGVSVDAGAAGACRMGDCAANVYSSAWMLDVAVPEAGATVAITFEGPADLSETPVLQLRIGVPTDRSVTALGPPALTITFRDADTSVPVAVAHPALFMPPGPPADPGLGVTELAYVGGAKVAANSIVVPLPAGIDATRVTAIEATFTPAGPGAVADRVLVADAWLNRATGSTSAPA